MKGILEESLIVMRWHHLLSVREHAYQNRPGPTRHLSKPIERPLSRQKESPRNAKALTVRRLDSNGSTTQIIRKTVKGVKDVGSPDLVVADESEELSMSDTAKKPDRITSE